MSVAPVDSATPPHATPLPRARGAARIGVERRGGTTRLADLYQSGSLRVRMPRGVGPTPEATLINTAGGLTGGDRIDISVRVGAGATLSLATQSAEKLYRAASDHARADVAITVEPEGRLAWLPRETIAFEGSALRRRLRIDLAPGARFLGVETWVAGRAAMGERLERADLWDDWRVRVDGVLAHAEALRVPPTNTARWLASPGGWNGARAVATVLLVSPNAPELVAEARASISDGRVPNGHVPTGGMGAADAWEGSASRLVVRLAAPDHLALQRRLVPLLALLCRRGLGFGNDGDPRGVLPLVWSV